MHFDPVQCYFALHYLYSVSNYVDIFFTVLWCRVNYTMARFTTHHRFVQYLEYVDLNSYAFSFGLGPLLNVFCQSKYGLMKSKPISFNRGEMTHSTLKLSFVSKQLNVLEK